MKVSEFIDTYSDDLLYLKDARHAFLTHPLRHDMRDHLDASLCRVAIVFSIGAVEAMLEEWQHRDPDSILKSYFAKNSSNNDRIYGLYSAFLDSGVRVNKEIFRDYLAVKYLRNTVVHSRWKSNEKPWILARGFPTDTRKLTREHLDKVNQVAQNMCYYIFLTEHVAMLDKARLIDLGTMDEKNGEKDDGILTAQDLDKIIWNNLDRISSRIWRDIEQNLDKAEFDWTAGYTRKEFEMLEGSQQKRLYYNGARQLCLRNPELFSQSRSLAPDALEFWQEYSRRKIARNLSEERVENALSVLRSPDFDPTNGGWSFAGQIEKLAYDSGLAVVRAVLGRNSVLSPESVLDALTAGSLAYRIIPNMSPIYLFSILLPIVDFENTKEYCAEASFAYKIFLLNRVWYSCIESGARFEEKDIHFAIQMSEEFASAYPGRPTIK